MITSNKSKSWSICKQILCEKNLYFNIKPISNSGFTERFLETPTTPEIPTPQTLEFTDIYKSSKFVQKNNWLDYNKNDPLITFVNSRTNSRQFHIFPREKEHPKRILADNTFKVLELPLEDLKKHKPAVAYFKDTKERKIIRKICALRHLDSRQFPIFPREKEHPKRILDDTFKVLELPPEDLREHKPAVGYCKDAKDRKIIREFCALRKKSVGIYNCINSQSRPKVFLLQFIYQLLQEYHSSVQWIDQDSFTFKILNPQTLAKMWGQYKVNPKMSFDSLTRSLRLSYKSGKLIKIPRTKNTYKFTCINNFINM